jgi:hypothetical protein
MTSPLTQAVDDRNQPYEALGFIPGAGTRLACNVLMQANTAALNSDYRIFTIVSDQNVWFEHRNNAIPVLANTTCQYLPANWILDVKVKNMTDSGNTYFAFQAVTIAANVYLMPRT